MGLVPYAIAALVVMGAIAGAGYRGYSLGSDHVRAEWAEAAAAAVQAAQENAERERAAARKAAGTLQTNLTKQRSLNGQLQNSLARHLAEIPPVPIGCPPLAVSDGVFDDINRAIAGPEGEARRKLPDTGRGTDATSGQVPSDGQPKTR